MKLRRIKDKDNIEEFLKEVTQTEHQLNLLQIYNKSFNKQMSSKYEGYDIESENDTDNPNFDPNISANSSEGNLSREAQGILDREDQEEEEVKNYDLAEDYNNNLIEVSPDSFIRSDADESKQFSQAFEDILFRDLSNDYEVNKVIEYF